MAWVAGIAGFILGFAGGLLLLRRWLKNVSNDELLRNKSFRIYSVFVWLVAAVTSAAAVWLYSYYY
ncbi:MAG: hypothetical protein DI586_05060 [Micavibrio aeruginosavorus]|uniref:Uncharacterized protein n=1 Tax=Micavibrio aeruginosavorus TaxID=349221 RepID=A0A2W5HQL8_9BACT|nr:MAG: hypothetical protein DI586_05060 [Micavibrio aeruginosavorus]